LAGDKNKMGAAARGERTKLGSDKGEEERRNRSRQEREKEEGA